MIKFLLETLSNKLFDYHLIAERAKHYRFRDKKLNVMSMHFPASYEEIDLARHELVYEEFFLFQYELAMRKIKKQKG